METKTTNTDLLRASVLKFPGEDTPRALFADSIEEDGDSVLAGIVRGMLGLGPRVNPSPELFLRYFAIDWWDRNVDERVYAYAGDNFWLASWGPIATHQAIVRKGFLEHVQCRAYDWSYNGDNLIKKWPIRTVAIVDGPDWTTSGVKNALYVADKVYMIPAGRSRPESELRARKFYEGIWPKVKFTWLAGEDEE